MGSARYSTENNLADLRGEWAFKAERPEQGLTEQSGTGNAELTETIHALYQGLCEYGYRVTDLYDLTLSELIETLEARREGHAYAMWKQAVLIGATMGKDFPKTPKEASPELFPAKKRFKMPEWLKERRERRTKDGQ